MQKLNVVTDLKYLTLVHRIKVIIVNNYLVSPTYLIIIGISIYSSSFSRTSKSNWRSTILNDFFGSYMLYEMVSHSTALHQVEKKECFCISNLELLK